ncbi:hypothetical protein G2W53_017721 [Senna tora]|uniref:MULE transposase domain-containing protein n=1 Tax=Senna tora TaxID=362788 RepID=A0A834TSG9_9FABA|nr:hypothetical protein G2W53_017721 [Senna tora]
MERGEEICNVTYRMPMTLCPFRFGELNLCDDYSVGMMFECFSDNATKLNGVELLVQTMSTSIVELDLNVSQVIDERLVHGRCVHSSRRNLAFGESSYQGTVYVNEDEGERRDPDFVPSDILDTSSEGDLEASGGPKFPDVPPSMDNPLFVGAMFDSKDALRQANPCKWRMRARERDYYWEITRYVGPCTCITPTLTQDNPKMDSSFITSCIVPDVRETPDIRVSAIIDRIHIMFNTTVKYKKAWRAKHKALARAFGNWDWSYATMRHWSEAARYFNSALRHPKPILQIDGTFLYEKYLGMLLLAVRQDGNKKVVQLAFAIMEKEKESAWHWFLTQLCLHLVTDRTDICLISDKHQGILNAVHDERLMWHPPYAENVYCVRNLSSNLNKAYKNTKLKKLFVQTARTTKKHRVEKNLRILRRMNSQAADWLDRISKRK